MSFEVARPLGDRILVRVDKSGGVERHGIYIPRGGDGLTGDVIAVGPGWKTRDGKLVPVDVKIGDKVIFIQHTGQETHINGEKLTMFREHDLIAILDVTDEPERKPEKVA
ncbi:MAG: co-chaperone GroES [Candidatus Zixiibacteriota bacterium]